MANVLIGYANRVDEAVLYGGSWLNALPLANIQNRTLSKIARSVDTALTSTKFTVDLGSAKECRLVSIVNHNLSLAAKYRIRGYSDDAMSVVAADSGWLDVWPAVYSSTSLDWSADNWWSGRTTNEARQGYTWTTSFALPYSTAIRYWRFEIDDTTNAAGFVQVGRVFVGPAWQPAVNPVYGSISIGWETGTEVSEAASGAEYFDRRTPYRVCQFTTGYMQDGEAGVAFDITRRMGIDGEVMFMFDPADTINALRRQYLGRLRQLSKIEYPYPSTHSVGWEIKELL